jgi:L-serine dehydratase
MRETGVIRLGGRVDVAFAEADIALSPQIVLDRHPNAITLTALGGAADVLAAETYFSVGGGFVVAEHEKAPDPGQAKGVVFGSARELLDLAARRGASICSIMAEHEQALRPMAEVRARLLHIRDVMTQCFERGIAQDGYLPGGLQVRRRARAWHERLAAEDPGRDPVFAEDWVNLVALAVNEENAGGGRVVTAPTNGAAGIIPAVLHYAVRYCPAGRADPDDTAVRFLLTAGAIGSLYKEMASISGAEVGCQGEVGSAASMAAGGLTEILGGTPAQVENAAEIAMEHSLGLTCDPIAGLVQIPCIERNAISAGKAINAARMAMRGDGTHRVSLDEVIETMRATGRDMSSKYKETSAGGLAVAVNVVEC